MNHENKCEYTLSVNKAVQDLHTKCVTLVWINSYSEDYIFEDNVDLVNNEWTHPMFRSVSWVLFCSLMLSLNPRRWVLVLDSQLLYVCSVLFLSMEYLAQALFMFSALVLCAKLWSWMFSIGPGAQFWSRCSVLVSDTPAQVAQSWFYINPLFYIPVLFLIFNPNPGWHSFLHAPPYSQDAHSSS